jgi:ADP-heptose:LPS heptosyltransferase
MPASAKPKLLVVELWGVGDLAIATPFLSAAAKKFDVTLLAKASAFEMQKCFWPEVKVVPFTAPWTAFRGKYHFWNWNWRELFALRKKLRAGQFDFGLSARPDPRDHPLLKFLGVKKRLGFPAKGSGIFLTQPLAAPEPTAHRYEFWRVAGQALGLELPARENFILPPRTGRQTVMVHSGARLPARIWPLAYYKLLVRNLREAGHVVQVVCDPDQQNQWQRFGETTVASPRTLAELFSQFDRAAVFIGNCSGPGHLAAISGVPTFTFFGPSLPERFLPLHPQAEFLEDKSCVYKPCKDYCHFSSPRCLENIAVENAWPHVQAFVQKHSGRK